MSGIPECKGDALFGEGGQNCPPLARNDETKREDGPSEDKSRHNSRPLTAARALEIFELRPRLKGPARRGAMMQYKAIASEFVVSPKTVREIWAGRAWARATRKEWTEAEIETRAFPLSLKMRVNSAGGTSNSSDTTGLLHRTTNKDAAANSLRIPALQHSLPAVGVVAPANQQIQYQAKLQAAALLGLSNGAVPSLQALLAAAFAPQRAVLQQKQTAPPQPHPTYAAQLLAQFAGVQTAAPHTVWGSGAHPGAELPAQDVESAIRFLQAKLAHLQGLKRPDVQADSQA